MLDYEIVIGLEVHSELATKSKIFCSCTTQFGGAPNTHCCPICQGMPGVLPVLNRKVIEFAAKAGLATNCEISRYSVLDRKNYFYPDLPKAYQISQLYHPLCLNGHIDIEVKGESKRVNIREIHIEEDAGKLVHDDYGNGTLVDYNRCGVPLIEIVTMPDMRSAEEVKEFLETLKAILEYTQVSDCKMQEGSLRADVNLSVMKKGSNELGTRTEMKNINSFKAIVRAIENEAKRQIMILEDGGKIEQETRRWDDAKAQSYSMRSKEEAHDYKYFPEPDLVPVEISNEWLEEIEKSIPELPHEKAKRYINEFNLPEYDSKVLTAKKELSIFFDKTVEYGIEPKKVSNWLMVEYMRLAKDEDELVFNFTPSDLADMFRLIDEGKITGKIAKGVFTKMYQSGKKPADIVKDEGLEVVSDEGELEKIILGIIDNNEKSVEDFINGKQKAIGFLVGQTMKATKGKADPKAVNKILNIELNKRKGQ